MADRPAHPPGGRSGRGLGLRGQLVVWMTPLAAAALLALVWLAARDATDAVRQQALRHLEAVRSAAGSAAAAYVRRAAAAVQLAAGDPRTAQALAAFAEAARRADDDPRATAGGLRAQLEDHLRRYYAAQIERRELDPQTLLPTQRGALWLQAQYVDTALPEPDDSAYAAAHAAWHRIFAATAARAGFTDVLLVRANGRVVYSVAKTPIFQTSLIDGPYAGSHLGALFRRLKTAPQADAAQLADFAPFVPARGQPAAFVGAPVLVDGGLAGVLVAQIDPDGLTAAVSADAQWEALGLGTSGDVFLAGADGTLRSASRFSAALAAHEPRVAANGSGVATYPAPALTATALRAGDSFGGNYAPAHGPAMLASIGPAGVGELGWQAVAEIAQSEALRPGVRLARRLSVAALVLGALVTLALFAVVTWHTWPLQRLAGALDALRPADAASGLAAAAAAGGSAAAPLAAAVSELVGRVQAQASEERQRRESEARGLAAVIEAARNGDCGQRAYAGGELAPLAAALNGLCDRLGAAAVPAGAAPDPTAAEALTAAAEHLRCEAARHLDAAEAADASAQRWSERNGEVAALVAEMVGGGQGGGRAAAVEPTVLADLAERIATTQRAGADAGAAARRAGEQSLSLADAVARSAAIADDLTVLALNAAIAAARPGAAAPAAPGLADEARQRADDALAACDALQRALAALQDETGQAVAALDAQAALLTATVGCVAEAELAWDGGAAVPRPGNAEQVGVLLALARAEPGAECRSAIRAARDAARRLCHAAEVVAGQAALLGAAADDRGAGNGTTPLAGARRE